MFEVDWAEPECEKVGQRKERKKLERELRQKDDDSVRSSQTTTTSSRASTSSDRNHFGFFGTLRRKKSSAPPTISKERGSSLANSAKVSLLPPVASKSTIDGSEPSSLTATDRSSKESMMSKLTHLTIPTLSSPRAAHTSAPSTPVDATPSQTVKGGQQAVVMTEARSTPHTVYIRREDGTFVPTNIYSQDDEESTSELINYWFNALQSPSQVQLQPGSPGLPRKDYSLAPPSAYSVPRTPTQVPATPTRRPSKRPPIPPRNPTRLKLRADDPDDWKTPAEWTRLAEMRNQAAGSAGEIGGWIPKSLGKRREERMCPDVVYPETWI
ncbi:hypothetical protein VTJ49DRAFT_5569 [Mycothermus thermophilus]|uniref:Uncharacterized protein n=1 Tax=Humicola insolens TaxID=85995 RepID=A0ABR3V2U7_HUMIN